MRREERGVRRASFILQPSGVISISYLDRLLEPITDVLTPEVARALVSLHAEPELEAHIDELRAKANAGTLTPEEAAEYKDFVEAVDVISILQSKARRFLANRAD